MMRGGLISSGASWLLFAILTAAVAIMCPGTVRAAQDWPEVRQVVSVEQELLLVAIPAEQRAVYEEYARTLVSSLGTSREALLGIAASFRLDRESGAWKFRPADEAVVAQAMQLFDECILRAEQSFGACPLPHEARHELLRTEMQRNANVFSAGLNPLWPAFRQPLAPAEWRRVRESCLSWIESATGAADLFAARFARSDAEHEAVWRVFSSEFTRQVLLREIERIEEDRIREAAWRIECELAGADLGSRPSVNVAGAVSEALGGAVQVNGGPYCLPSDRVHLCMTMIDDIHAMDPRFALVNEETAADIRQAVGELRCLLATGDDEAVSRVIFGLRWRIANAAKSVYIPLPAEQRERRADQTVQLLEAMRDIGREFRRSPSSLAGLDQVVDDAVDAAMRVVKRQLADSTLPTVHAPLDPRTFEEIIAKHQSRIAETWANVRSQFSGEFEELQRTGTRITSDSSLDVIFNVGTRRRMHQTATRAVESLTCGLMREYAFAGRLPLTADPSIVFFSEDDPEVVRFGCDSSGIQVGIGMKP